MKAIFTPAVVPALLACTLASPSSASKAPPPGGSIFVQVARWHGPTNTMITLTPEGDLQRLEGSLLILRQQGRRTLRPDTTRLLLEAARRLEELPAKLGDWPVEGDLYMVVTQDGRVLSTIETEAPEGLRSFVAAVLREAEPIPLQPNTGYFLSAETVLPDRVASLRAAGTKLLLLSGFEAPARSKLERAIEAPYLLHPLSTTDFQALLQAFGGREAFLSLGEGWHQASLWSPPQ